MANPCLDIVPKDTEKRADYLEKIAKKYFADSFVKVYSGRKGDWDRLYRELLPGLDFNLSELPTMKELKKLDRHIDKYLKNIKKLPGTMGKLFKLPEVIMNKFPTTKRYFHELGRTADFHRAYTRDFESDLNDITTLLNMASGQNGLLKKGGFTRSTAQKEYKNLLTEYERIKQTEGKVKAGEYYNNEIADLHASGSLSALERLHDLMVNPWLSKKQSERGELKYNQPLIQAANIWHLKSPTGTIALKNRLWKALGDGLKDTIDMLEARETRYTKNTLRIDKLNDLYNDYFAPNAPKKVENYFPRQIIDIAPTLSKLSEDIWSNNVRTNPETVSKYIDRMIDKVISNLKEPANLYERGEYAPEKLSKDVIGILDTYGKNALRFNHNARVSKLTTKGLQELQTLTGTAFDKHADFFSQYIMDTHNAALGLNFRNSKLAAISRAITSYQFTSKLGFNVRSALRNSTQALQHWVWWGRKGLMEAYNDSHSANMKEIINNEMKMLGYEFINIRELAQPRDLLNNLEIDASGAVKEINPGVGSQITDMLEGVARVSGKPMEWVENKFNRGVAFKIAFLQKYRQLKTDDSIVRRAIVADSKAVRKDYKSFYKDQKRKYYDKNNDKITTRDGKKEVAWDDLSIGERTRNEIIRRSSSYATDMVRHIHYLYDPYAKPQIIRGPVGSVLGQFTTYSINFFEYQRKIAAEGGNALLAKEWSSPEVARLGRLGMLYLFTTGLSSVANTSFNNIIENDTWERIKQFDMWFGGTPEEKNKAFYGKHPVVATFGGPFVSDVIQLGNIMGLSNMGSGDFQSYRSGYKHFNERIGTDDRVEQLLRLLNTQIGRTVYTSLPRVINGTSVPTVIGQDLGLYNTPELRDLKKKLLWPLQQTPFPKINKYFTPDKRYGRSKKKKTKKESSPLYSKGELDLILKALRSIH